MIGIDIVEVSRIRDACQNEAFMHKVYTQSEIARIKERDGFDTAAGIFAAKEAVAKALGTGISGGISWRDIEIAAVENGKPLAVLSGKAKTISDSLGTIEISISHSGGTAVAVAVILPSQLR